MASNPASTGPVPFSFEVEPGADKIVVRCTGSLTSEHTHDFQLQVRPLVLQTQHLQFDLSRVPYIDSSGLGTLVSLYTSARAAHCELKLVGFNEQIRNLLHITNLLWIFE
jgi:anti-sigma B factor antagonist